MLKESSDKASGICQYYIVIPYVMIFFFLIVTKIVLNLMIVREADSHSKGDYRGVWSNQRKKREPKDT
jgi:hypothetical protein